jgi:flagellar biosynthesis protein FliP
MVTSFLLKKITKQTPYSPISYFKKKKKKKQPPTQPCALIIPSFNMKLLKTPNNLTTLEYP